MTANPNEPSSALYKEVQAVLDETLSLGGRGYSLKPDSPLFGALPELDSQAVLSILLGIEERFSVTIADEDVSADAFATLRSLASWVAALTDSQ